MLVDACSHSRDFAFQRRNMSDDFVIEFARKRTNHFGCRAPDCGAAARPIALTYISERTIDARGVLAPELSADAPFATFEVRSLRGLLNTCIRIGKKSGQNLRERAVSDLSGGEGDGAAYLPFAVRSERSESCGDGVGIVITE
jgi:hypothetical protein